MLEEMPEESRREWTDLSVILDSGMQRRYRRLPETERADFEQRRVERQGTRPRCSSA